MKVFAKISLSNTMIIDSFMPSCQLPKKELDQLPNRECRRMRRAILGPPVLVTESLVTKSESNFKACKAREF